MNNKKTYLFGLLTGVLLGLAFPPLQFSFLAFVGFVPLLYVIEVRDGKKIFSLLYLTFFLYQIITNWWVSSWQPNCDPFLFASGIALDFLHPFFFLIPMYAYLAVRRRLGISTALWSFPFIWTAYEWLHGLGEFSYPWLNIGYTQAYNRAWVQIADLAGVWGVSFLILLINIFVVRIIFIYIGEKSANISLKFYTLPKVRILIISMFVLIISPYIYGIFKLNEFDHKNLIKTKKTMRIGIIQPNIDPWAKWASSVVGQISLHLDTQDSLIKADPEIDMFLWSETAIPFVDLNMNSSHNFNFILRHLINNKVSLLTGFADIYFYQPNDAIPFSAKKTKDGNTFYDSFNAAAMINSNLTDTVQVYHKMRLTPFSERLPYADKLKFAKGWIEWGVGISSWQIGKNQHPLIYRSEGKSISIGAIICIESIYPDFTRNYINQGAEALVVITNDAWYNYTFGPEQHFIISEFRAIESRRYIARCANSGVSGFITATGDRYDMLPQYKTIGKAGTIALLNYKTLYDFLGDWIPYISFVVSLVMISFGFVRKAH